MNHIPYKYLIIFFIVLVSFGLVNAQTNVNPTLQNIYSKLLKAKDYSVMAHIKVDMPFIRILPINAEIYFKQKDKFKVKSKGIAIVPKQGFAQASKMLADMHSFTAVPQGTEMIAGVPADIISIIPLSDTSDLILGKLWIDTKLNVILKSQLTTRSNGTILIEYTYGTQVDYGLPDQMIFSVEIKKFKIPINVAADTNNTSVDKDDKTKGDKKGKIIITFTNYQINKGIPDSIFNDK
jgi:hypothetical protein